MSFQNIWKIDRILGTQADTYIEKRFEEECETFPNGSKILNEWRQRKGQYISYTDTIVFDYQHYSRHDVTHSVKILEAIQLILGQERVNMLEAGDLWLLLESAYFHDIGMAVTYKDLVEIWESDEFQEYLDSPAMDKDEELKTSKLWYVQMDNLVHDRDKMTGIEDEQEILFQDGWPVELERKLLYLVTGFIRKDHAKRCRKYLKRFSNNITGVIPERLYEVVAQIAISHGEAFEYIQNNLKVKSQGLGMDYIHPQFVAALLRLGDLLDMDNNRFNIRALEHYGRIPWISMLHLKKHKAMTHIVICYERIEAEASDKNAEVCRVTQEWFQFIDQEVINLICYWSDIAPRRLGGCLMKRANCCVYHPAPPIVFKADCQKIFEVDKAKLMDLLIGVNIYDMKLDFLREYIQNALDASKMQLWLDLKSGRYRYQYNPEMHAIEELAPFDIPWEVYDQYMIEIRVDLHLRSQTVTIEITDQGIGMEEACLEVISKIGLGWRGRKHYNEEIPRMPSWLRPTGGFGVGIQSAFMLSDKIELLTKSDWEKQAHRVILKNPKSSGIITEETGDLKKERGTTVKLKIDLEYFQKWNEEHNRIPTKKPEEKAEQELLDRESFRGSDIFEESATLDYIISFLENYLKKIVANSMIPIRIVNSNRRPFYIRTKYMKLEPYWDKDEEYVTGVEKIGEETYRWIFESAKRALMTWNESEAVYTYICLPDTNMSLRKPDHTTCFKNVCVVRNTEFDMPIAAGLEICIDFMGHSAESALKVHRNAFNEGFSQKKYIQESILIFIKAMEHLSKNRNGAISGQAKTILQRGYLPLIDLLYVNKNIVISEQAEKSEPGLYYKLKVTESESENHMKYEVEKSLHTVSLVDLLKKIRAIMDKDSKEVIFFDNRNCVKGGETEIVLNRQTTQTLLDYIHGKEKPIDVDDFVLQQEILKRLEEGIAVIQDKNIYDILKDSNYFSIDYLNLELEDMPIELLQVKTKIESTPKAKSMDAFNFYKESYGGLNERKLFGMPDSEKYRKLLVSVLPYQREMQKQGPYLISPINEEIREKVRLKIGNRKIAAYTKVYPYKNFVKLVTGADDFEAVLKWVYQNQLIPKQYAIGEIRDEYIEYVTDIYNNYVRTLWE